MAGISKKGAVIIGWREGEVSVMVTVEGNPDLFKVTQTLATISRFTDLLDGGDKKSDEDSDYCNDNK